VNSYILLGALQKFVEQRSIAVIELTAEPAIAVMLDWFRLVRVDRFDQTVSRDALVFRYGGWSEGCATGYRFSLLRRVTEKSESGGDTEWFAGITLLFELSDRSELPPFSTTSSDWESLDAFAEAIGRSPGFRALVTEKPMGAFLESGGLR
jgi:hypothetical protein